MRMDNMTTHRVVAFLHEGRAVALVFDGSDQIAAFTLGTLTDASHLSMFAAGRASVAEGIEAGLWAVIASSEDAELIRVMP